MTDGSQTPAVGELRKRIAKAALDAAAYDSLDDPWCTDPDVCEGPVTWDVATEKWRRNGYRIADAVLAVLPAPGERMVPADVVAAIEMIVDNKPETSDFDWTDARDVVRAWLAEKRQDERGQ